ncbi:band 4.1-like protein 4A [Psammomys obesus]|uniref:band 4.1-like protein 4A n=1 Tax=Psammomys obesus TaxID=48139 RepID=UPI0024532F61|nr:band 4.1-like protein 4A [Psammomys obesus]
MGCFCAVPEEFYCEVLLLDESKLTLTTQQQGIKKSTKGSVVLDHVFRHINLVEIDYFGLRYCDRSHQTVAHVASIFATILQGQAPSEAELNYLRIAKSLEMYGVDLHPVYGENKSEYFLGLTPVAVVVYKNKKQVGKYFWPRITKVHFKETQFELRVLGKDCNETSFFFEARSKTACKHLWKCSVEHHTFFRMPETESNSLSRKLSKFGSISYKHRYSGRTALQMSRDLSIQLPRPNQIVVRSRSKTYPKRVAQTQPAGSNNISRITANMENGENEGTTKIIAPSPVKSFKKAKNENSPDTQRSKSHAPWEDNGPQSGLYNSSSDRTKSPKFPCTRQRNLSCGSDNDSTQPMRRRKTHNSGEDSDLKQRRRSRSRCNTSSGSESENSNREHRKKRNRVRQENDMVDSAPQWEAVLRRQKEKNQVDPNNRRSRHRSRSYVGSFPALLQTQGA